MLIKIIFIGLSICLLNIFLKKQLSEFVLPIEIVFLALAVSLCTEYLQNIFSEFSDALSGMEYGEEILTSAVKGSGICIITKFSSDVCAESGNKTIADAVEFTGRIMLAVIAIPYIESIMSTALAFIK